VLVIGLWANWHLIAWTGLAVVGALVGIMTLYGVQLDKENRRRARERDLELPEQEREMWT
jgi:hypothetical protein